jgi:hypothetical protein
MGGGNSPTTCAPYCANGLSRRQLAQPSKPWCSSEENIANMQYRTYSFPTTVSGGISSTKIMSSNDQFIGIWYSKKVNY